MLTLAILLLVSGYTLVYAGMKRGGAWQRPWQPIADALGG